MIFKKCFTENLFFQSYLGTSKNTQDEILITDESFGNPASPTHSNTSSTAKSNKKISFQVKGTRSSRSSKISISETDDIRYGFKYKMHVTFNNFGHKRHKHFYKHKFNHKIEIFHGSRNWFTFKMANFMSFVVAQILNKIAVVTVVTKMLLIRFFKDFYSSLSSSDDENSRSKKSTRSNKFSKSVSDDIRYSFK